MNSKTITRTIHVIWWHSGTFTCDWSWKVYETTNCYSGPHNCSCCIFKLFALYLGTRTSLNWALLSVIGTAAIPDYHPWDPIVNTLLIVLLLQFSHGDQVTNVSIILLYYLIIDPPFAAYCWAVVCRQFVSKFVCWGINLFNFYFLYSRSNLYFIENNLNLFLGCSPPINFNRWRCKSWLKYARCNLSSIKKHLKYNCLHHLTGQLISRLWIDLIPSFE